jgi:uncharacterized protein (DUF1697 family)
MHKTIQLVAFLRGINVGGHHKVPMADLRQLLTDLGYQQVRTLLNSGNVVFRSPDRLLPEMEAELEQQLAQAFGFPIPVFLLYDHEIVSLIFHHPFNGMEQTDKIKHYVSFLKESPPTDFALPWQSADGSCQILGQYYDKAIFSLLDLRATKTPKGMEELEKAFGKNITTRNWNTVEKIRGLMR